MSRTKKACVFGVPLEQSIYHSKGFMYYYKDGVSIPLNKNAVEHERNKNISSEEKKKD